MPTLRKAIFVNTSGSTKKKQVTASDGFINKITYSDGPSLFAVQFLRAWIRADLGIFLSGTNNKVKQWLDKSGWGIKFVQTGSSFLPDLTSSVPNLNSKAGIFFDGVDDFMDGGKELDPGTNSMYIACVYRSTATSRGRPVQKRGTDAFADGGWFLRISNSGAGGENSIFIDDEGPNFEVFNNYSLTDNNQVDGNIHVQEFIWDRPNGNLTGSFDNGAVSDVNEGKTGDASNANVESSLNLSLGTAWNSTNPSDHTQYFQGHIAEVFIYIGSGSLPVDNLIRPNLFSYVNERYNTSF